MNTVNPFRWILSGIEAVYMTGRTRMTASYGSGTGRLMFDAIFSRIGILDDMSGQRSLLLKRTSNFYMWPWMLNLLDAVLARGRGITMFRRAGAWCGVGIIERPGRDALEPWEIYNDYLQIYNSIL